MSVDKALKRKQFSAIDPSSRFTAATKVNTTDLASSTGSTMVGHKRSSAAILRSAYTNFTDVFSMKDYCPADGTNQNTAFAAGITQAIVEGKSRIILPAGHYLLDSIAVSQNGLIFEGDGENTLVQVAANNSVIFSVTGQRISFKGMKMLGDSTTSASTNGIAMLAGDSESLLVEDVWFDSFGFGAINVGYTTAIRGLTARRTRHRSTATAGSEIYCRGKYETLLVEEMDAVTSNADWAVFSYDEGVTGQRDTSIDKGYFNGYKRYSIGISDENPNGEDRQFGVKITGGFHKNAAWGSIKVKNYRGVLVQGVVTESCGLDPQTAQVSSGESGSMYINSGGLVEVASCKIKDSGNDGIVLAQGSPYPYTNADGTNKNQYILRHNQVDVCGTTAFAGTGTAFKIGGGPHQVLVDGNQARGAIRYALEVGSSAADWIETATIVNNDLSHNPATTAGIYAQYVRNLKLDANEVHNVGLRALFTQNVDNVTSGPLDRLIDTIGGGFNVRIDDATNIKLLGDYGCTVHAAWAATTAVVAGQKVSNGANTYVCELAGTTGSTAPTHTSGTVSDGGVDWRYWGKHRAPSAAVALRGAAATHVIFGNTTRVAATQSPSGIDFSPFPTRWEWLGMDGGTTTLASGTKVVNLNRIQINTNYGILLTGDVNETFYVSAKTTTTFTITSSNASSTANVSWQALR